MFAQAPLLGSDFKIDPCVPWQGCVRVASFPFHAYEEGKMGEMVKIFICTE